MNWKSECKARAAAHAGSMGKVSNAAVGLPVHNPLGPADTTCPLCHQDNHCEVARGNSIAQCWCRDIEITEAAQVESCMCRDCASRSTP